MSAEILAKAKPCPFCGSKDHLEEGEDVPQNTTAFYFVRCFNCYCQGPDADNLEEAVNRWNIRA